MIGHIAISVGIVELRSHTMWSMLAMSTKRNTLPSLLYIHTPSDGYGMRKTLAGIGHSAGTEGTDTGGAPPSPFALRVVYTGNA